MQSRAQLAESKFDFSFVRSLDAESRKVVDEALGEIQGLPGECFNSDFFQARFRVPLLHSLRRSMARHAEHYSGGHRLAFAGEAELLRCLYFVVESKIGAFFAGFKKFDGLVSVDIAELSEVVAENREMGFIKNTVNQGQVVIRVKKQAKGAPLSPLTQGSPRGAFALPPQPLRQGQASPEDGPDSFEVLQDHLALTQNATLEESLRELDRVLQAELTSFDRVKNVLFVFDTYFLGRFDLDADADAQGPPGARPEFGKHFRNLQPKSESKADWAKRKGVAGAFNAMIVVTNALDSLEKMNFFSQGGPLYFARESARFCLAGSPGSRPGGLKAMGSAEPLTQVLSPAASLSSTWASMLAVGVLLSPVAKHILGFMLRKSLLKLGSWVTITALRKLKHKSLNKLGVKMVEKISRQYFEHKHYLDRQLERISDKISRLMQLPPGSPRSAPRVSQAEFVSLVRMVEALAGNSEAQGEQDLARGVAELGLQVEVRLDPSTGQEVLVVDEADCFEGFEELN